MQLARVTGTVVATQKHEKLVGAKLLLVQPVDAGGTAQGAPLLAVDAAQAGVGEHVLVVQEGRAAVAAIRRPFAPADTAIVGIVDRVDGLDGRPVTGDPAAVGRES
jgi:ethanolamine utilization protein EutN